jgi:naphthalene 1,2-dioxygenase system ferredoxin subunit
MSEWQRVAALSELEPDYPKGVKAAGRDIALYLVEGNVYATDNICSHAYARLSDGFVDGFQVICPLHQGSFDVRTGAVIDPPCVEPIATFECRVEDDDVLVKIGAAA